MFFLTNFLYSYRNWLIKWLTGSSQQAYYDEYDPQSDDEDEDDKEKVFHNKKII